MKLPCLAAFVAVVSLALVPSTASADISWDLDQFLTESSPAGSGPWARVTIANMGDVDGSGDGFDDVKFTIELFLTGAEEFMSRIVFNLDPALDPDDLFATYVSGDQPDNADFETGTDSRPADGQGFGDFEFDWPNGESDDRFEGNEMVMYYVSHNSQDLDCLDFDFEFSDEDAFANVVARVQGIGPDGEDSAWIANPEPSSMVLAALGLGGLGLTRVRRRKPVAQAA